MLGLDIAYMLAKFDHSSFSRSGDMVGAHHNLKWFTWPDHAPFRDRLPWSSTCYDQPIYQTWNLYLYPLRPAHMTEWSAHSAATCSRPWSAQWPRFAPHPGVSAYQRIISNDSYAHDKQRGNPRQVRGFDGVIYKLWPLLMPWLAASRCQPHWRESQSRYMWQSPLARGWRSVSQVARGWKSAGQGWRWINASPGLARQ